MPIEDITSFNQSESNIQDEQAVRNSNSPNFNSWCPNQNQNILSLANSLLNSPIIRQMSIKNSNNSSTLVRSGVIDLQNENDRRQKQVTFNEEKNSVQVSGFETKEEEEKLRSKRSVGLVLVDESNLTSNSSAFSLFKPNEELRSFF